MEEEKPLKDTFASINANVPNCVILPATPAIHFEIRPATIGMLPSFHGLARESPYNHLGKFLSICSTFKNQNLDDENVRLRLFPFSLHDKAASWLNSLPENSIRSWEQFVKKFKNKFYSMSKTNEMRQALQDFHQKPDEQFYEAWNRFQDLIINCPHHGLEKSRLVQSFYNGLTSSSRNMIESMHKEKFMNLTPTAAYKFLSELGEDSQQ